MRFDERFVAAMLAAAAVLLAGCGASAPARPAGEERADAGGEERAQRSEAGAPDEPVPPAALADHEAAIAAMQRGDATEAELTLERLMLEYPALPGPFVNAAILYMQDGRDAEARAALEMALAIEPLHPQANNQLGILLRRNGEFAAAEQAYRRAMEGDPAYLPAIHNLGVLLDLYVARPDEALALYERYQSALADPNEAVARWIVDLTRRVARDGTASVAQGEAP